MDQAKAVTLGPSRLRGQRTVSIEGHVSRYIGLNLGHFGTSEGGPPAGMCDAVKGYSIHAITYSMKDS